MQGKLEKHYIYLPCSNTPLSIHTQGRTGKLVQYRGGFGLKSGGSVLDESNDARKGRTDDAGNRSEDKVNVFDVFP